VIREMTQAEHDHAEERYENLQNPPLERLGNHLKWGHDAFLRRLEDDAWCIVDESGHILYDNTMPPLIVTIEYLNEPLYTPSGFQFGNFPYTIEKLEGIGRIEKGWGKILPEEEKEPTTCECETMINPVRNCYYKIDMGPIQFFRQGGCGIWASSTNGDMPFGLKTKLKGFNFCPKCGRNLQSDVENELIFDF